MITFLGRFLVNGGMSENGDVIKTSDMLKIEFRDRKLQLSNKEIYLGPKCDSLLQELGLTRSSPELVPWFDQVRSFYCEAVDKGMKYFKPALSSKVLQSCDILHPKTFFSTSLDDLKRKFKTLATKFNSVINISQIPALLDQISSLRNRSVVKERLKEYISPVEFYSRLVTWEQEKYRLVGILGCALLTTHGSGSTAERDISLMNCVVGDPKRNRTGQRRLEARLSLKSCNLNLKHKCLKCQSVKERRMERKEAKRNNNDGEEDSSEDEEKSEDDEKSEKVKQLTHCHCPIFVVTDGMMAAMASGQPSQKYKADVKEMKEKLKME